MAIDFKNLELLETKLRPEEFSKQILFIKSSVEAKVEDIKVSYLTEVVSQKEDIQSKDILDKFEQEDKELDIQIKAMIDRWVRSTNKEILKEDQEELCVIAKKLYYERLRTGESRGFWRTLREHITGVPEDI